MQAGIRGRGNVPEYRHETYEGGERFSLIGITPDKREYRVTLNVGAHGLSVTLGGVHKFTGHEVTEKHRTTLDELQQRLASLPGADRIAAAHGFLTRIVFGVDKVEPKDTREVKAAFNAMPA